MTQAKLNTQLYQKMFAEQEKYKDWLRALPPDEIMNHAYEYTSREDILIIMEEACLSAKQARALLKSPCPLDDVYKNFCKQEYGRMDQIRDAIESRANEVMRADFIAQRRGDAR